MKYRVTYGEFRENGTRIILRIIGCDDGTGKEVLSSLLDLGYTNPPGPTPVSGTMCLIYDPPDEIEAGRIRNEIHLIMGRYGLRSIAD